MIWSKKNIKDKPKEHSEPCGTKVLHVLLQNHSVPNDSSASEAQNVVYKRFSANQILQQLILAYVRKLFAGSGFYFLFTLRVNKSDLSLCT